MADTVWPTENDIGAAQGDGQWPTEANLKDWHETLGPSSYLPIVEEATAGEQSVSAPGAVVGSTSFSVSSTVGLTANLASGECLIRGRRVLKDATAVALTDNKHNSVYLQLGFTSGLVTSVDYVVKTSDAYADLGTPPADSILLWIFETVSGSVATTWDYRQFARSCVAGTYIGDGTNGRTIALAHRPKCVWIVQRGAGGMTAISHCPLPQESASSKGICWWEPSSGEDPIAIKTDDAAYVPNLVASGFLVDGSAGTEVADRWIAEASKTWDPSSIPAQSSVSTTLTVTGAAVGDYVLADFDQSTLPISAQVTAADTVTAILHNYTAGAVDPASGTLTARVLTRSATGESLNTTSEVYDFVAWS